MVGNETHIKLKKLSVGYSAGRNKRTIIPCINLEAPRGSLIALVGANGTGKSTLLKTLAGLQPPLQGDIEIQGRQLQDYGRPELARKLSFVGTHYDMHSMMRVHQVVSYGRYPYTNIVGKLHETDREQIRKAMHDTGIILLDEPTAFLDVRNKFEVLHLLGKLAHERQKIILFSSHDLQIVLGTADLLWFIDQKKIIQGLPEELVLKNTINELFRHSEVFFDPEENEFRIQRQHKFTVNLKGTGALFKWTQRALDRLHIKTGSREGLPEITIEEQNGEITWIVSYEDKTQRFQALEDLIRYLYKLGLK